MLPSMSRAALVSTRLPAHALACRNCLRPAALPSVYRGKRWLHLKTIAKMEDAESKWQADAKEIEEGKRELLFDNLEKRGFVKDLVG